MPGARPVRTLPVRRNPRPERTSRWDTTGGYGIVVISARDLIDVHLEVMLGPSGGTITAGGSRWREIEREGRVSLPDFAGTDLYRMDVEVMFDGWQTNPPRSVEHDIRLLERLTVVPASHTRPPRVTVWGPVPRTELDWVIDGPVTMHDGEQDVIRARYPITGERVRQRATIHLLEWEADETLTESLATSRKTGKGKGHKRKTTTVRRGERYVFDVARRVYKDRRRGEAIARANGFPVSLLLREGQRLLLP